MAGFLPRTEYPGLRLLSRCRGIVSGHAPLGGAKRKVFGKVAICYTEMDGFPQAPQGKREDKSSAETSADGWASEKESGASAGRCSG